MSTSTIRINKRTHNLLHEIKSLSGQSMQEIVEKALTAYKEKHFWDEVNQAYCKLKNTSGLVKEKEERELWDVTLSDGLGDD
ncbi:MAG: toxin-antitoxin system protein [bacterium]